MIWTPSQSSALDAVGRWLTEPNQQIFRLFGWAGTGKTTLARHFAEHVPTRFAAYTGKAALVMRKNGCANASTIHSLIYTPFEDEGSEDGVYFELRRREEFASCELIIIDECSMVDADLALDLLSFKKKVLVLGDPAQLPPIEGTGYFVHNWTPDVMLTDIQRQARDNPIIDLATRVREGRSLELGAYGSSSVVRDEDDGTLFKGDQLLVGKNDTRRRLNRKYRQSAFPYTGLLPDLGERLICLRNDHKAGVLNGEQFRLNAAARQLNDKYVEVDVTSLDQPEHDRKTFRAHRLPLTGWPLEKGVRKRFRYSAQEFDLAYAITVHKAQGSQWDHVVIYDEWSGRTRQQWLYTALTRAVESVTVVWP